MVTQRNHNETYIQLATNPAMSGERLEPALRRLAEVTCATLDIDRIDIWRISCNSRQLQCIETYIAHQKTHSTGQVLNMDALPKYMGAIQNARYIDIIDANQDPRVAELKRELWNNGEVKASIHVPIRIGGKSTGVVQFNQSVGTRVWSQQDIQFASQITDLVAITLLNFQIKTSERQFEAVQATSTEITTSYNLNRLLDIVVERSARMLDANMGLLFLVDINLRELICTHGYQMPVNYKDLVIEYRQGAAGRVAHTGQALLIDDYRIWKDREPVFDDTKPFTSLIAIPLNIKESLIGVLQIMRTEENHPFCPQDQPFLGMMADLAAIAIEQDLLIEAGDRQQNNQTALAQIIEAANCASGLPDMTQTTLELLLTNMRLTRGLIRLDGQSTIQDIPADIDVKIETQLINLIDQPDALICINDIAVKDHKYGNLIEAIKTTGARAFMIAPILISENPGGYICVVSQSPRVWLQNETTLIETAARQLTFTARSNRYCKRIEMQNNFTRRLNTISRRLNHLMTFEEAVEEAGLATLEFLNAEKTVIALRDPDGELHSAWANGIDEKSIEDVLASEERTIIENFLSSANPTWIEDVSEETKATGFEELTSREIRSILGLPLVYDNQTVGSIFVFYPENFTGTLPEPALMETFSRMTALALQNCWMYNQLEQGYLELAMALANTIEERETNLWGATIKLAQRAEQTARQMGCTEEEVKDIRWAALLHDIGKAHIPDKVLRKPGPLTADEKTLIQKSPETGEEMLRPLLGYRNVASILRSCHERFDGSGYPDRRKGRQIPLGARVLAVADAFSSMVDGRPYRQPLDEDKARIELLQNAGSQFDPAVVNTFLEAIANA